MAEIYNLTAMTSVTNLGDMAVATNTILGGYYFGYFIIGMVWFITFIFVRSKQWNTTAAAITATWLMTIVGMFLRPIGLIDNLTFWILIIMGSLMVPAAILRGRNE
jgi:hypothetical protein